MRKPPSSLYFRPFHNSDRAGLIQNCYQGRLPTHLYSYIEPADRLTSQFPKQTVIHILGILNTQVIASGFLFKTPTYTEIADLYVAEAYRKQGIGTALIWYLRDIATEQGWRRLELTVLPENKQAYKLYTRLGFIEKSRFEFQNREVILMVLNL